MTGGRGTAADGGDGLCGWAAAVGVGDFDAREALSGDTARGDSASTSSGGSWSAATGGASVVRAVIAGGGRSRAGWGAWGSVRAATQHGFAAAATILQDM